MYILCMYASYVYACYNYAWMYICMYQIYMHIMYVYIPGLIVISRNSSSESLSKPLSTKMEPYLIRVST
jgi:hypothetical protein